MNEIRCPKCNEVFQVNESDFEQILRQVRDEEFEKELKRRQEEMEKNRAAELQIERLQNQQKLAEEIAKKNSEIDKKNAEIANYKSMLDKVETEKQLAIMTALQDKDKELSEKNTKITELNGKLDSKDTEHKLREQTMKEKYENELKAKDELIDQYKDFKARLSTKMVGESLEQHCHNEFNKVRNTAYPNAYFEKDNDAKNGSKGDFIFRDYDNGLEYISIMFEMKNENDETATKHKNEDFFDKLDKDRREKKCEYAVLVSMLEMNNEYYNEGIVDVSYRYPKMFVIRPQFFIILINLLANAAKNSITYQRQLVEYRNQQIDITNFESNMNDFKDKFSKNFETAANHFQKVIEDIDKSIAALNKTKDELLTTGRQLRLANDKAQDLTIKKLTKNAPSVKAMFDDLKN
ncbi:MAG: DUF2130 domain-containing protein [Saccharofermentans sp.]|nr:DUF2130 domain-containing protein [Saccharofermentans sp.]